VIVDDSIVRGTTSKARVTSLKEAGASEVHVLVSCPPHMNPCVYGIDFPDRSKLMAVNHTLDEMRRYLNADSLAYLSLDGMVRAVGAPKESFCMACYNGDYPVPFSPTLEKHIMERRASRAEGFSKTFEHEARQTKLL
jgi:amidophosphoribosyltransferase